MKMRLELEKKYSKDILNNQDDIDNFINILIKSYDELLNLSFNQLLSVLNNIFKNKYLFDLNDNAQFIFYLKY